MVCDGDDPSFGSAADSATKSATCWPSTSTTRKVSPAVTAKLRPSAGGIVSAGRLSSGISVSRLVCWSEHGPSAVEVKARACVAGLIGQVADQPADLGWLQDPADGDRPGMPGVELFAGETVRCGVDGLLRRVNVARRDCVNPDLGRELAGQRLGQADDPALARAVRAEPRLTCHAEDRGHVDDLPPGDPQVADRRPGQPERRAEVDLDGIPPPA